jgi:hypothetical protein
VNTSERLHAWLAAQNRVRFDRDALLRGFAAACPEYMGSGEQRVRLHEALQRLEQAGRVRLPSPKSRRSWDAVGNPKLPTFAVLIMEKRVRQDFSQTAWVPELATLATRARREDQLFTLQRLNNFLIEQRGKLDCFAPYRERALQIFGDEKYFGNGAIKGNMLYGEIPLAVFGAMNPAPPLPREDFHVAGSPLLLVENHHTYWSLLEWNKTALRYTSIAYVSGNTFSLAGRALADAVTRSRATHAEHFGDVDPEGLRIPAAMSVELRSCGLSALRPALSMYRWLFEHGHRRGLPTGAAPLSAAAAAWCGPELSSHAQKLFGDGHWIPQESLGLEQLRTLILTAT